MFLSNRKNEPAHYLLKIESFSILSEAGPIKIESDVFEASGYKWRLDLHPNGNEDEEVDNHISLYLRISDTESLPKGWKVDVEVNFFIYDHSSLHYISFQDDDGNRTRFHENKMKWGFDKLISLENFTKSSKGYLLNDSCVFGAEVSAIPDYTLKDRCLSMIKPPSTMNTYSWTIDKFSAVKEKYLTSEVFKVGKLKWTSLIHPKGNGSGAGTHLSVFLRVHEAALLPDGWRLYAKYELRVKNQRGYADEVQASDKWFCKSSNTWGFPRIMQLSELSDISKGFVLNDRMIVEVKISLIGMLRNFI